MTATCSGAARANWNCTSRTSEVSRVYATVSSVRSRLPLPVVRISTRRVCVCLCVGVYVHCAPGVCVCDRARMCARAAAHVCVLCSVCGCRTVIHRSRVTRRLRVATKRDPSWTKAASGGGCGGGNTTTTTKEDDEDRQRRRRRRPAEHEVRGPVSLDAILRRAGTCRCVAWRGEARRGDERAAKNGRAKFVERCEGVK